MFIKETLTGMPSSLPNVTISLECLCICLIMLRKSDFT